MLDTIPGPLRDRMEVIELPCYTEDEKVGIARRFLIARQLKATGLTPEQVEITDEALHALVARLHARGRRAQPRAHDRRRAALGRGAGRRRHGPRRRVIDAADLTRSWAAAGSRARSPSAPASPGVATGLAWTPVGGDILFIEATRIPGKGELILTGQLGDVMRESAQAALSLVKSRAADLGIDEKLLRALRHPRPRAGRRHPQGRPLGRRRHVHRAGLADDQPQGPPPTSR